MSATKSKYFSPSMQAVTSSDISLELVDPLPLYRRVWETYMLVPVFLIAATLNLTPQATIKTLRSRDQALLNAVTQGSRRLWEDALANGAVYVDENGLVMDRETYLRTLRPLPPNISGRIRIATYRAAVSGDMAIVVHTDDESEVYHGIQLRAKYVTTETWQRQHHEWKLMLVHVYVGRDDPPSIPLPASQLQQYAGTFKAGTDLTAVISLNRGTLSIRMNRGKSHPLLAEARDVFFVPGQPRIRLFFHHDASGAVDSFIDRRENEDIVWHRR